MLLKKFIPLLLLWAPNLFAGETCFIRPNGPLEYLVLPKKICLSHIVVEKLTFERSLVWDSVESKVIETQALTGAKATAFVSADEQSEFDVKVELTENHIIVDLTRDERNSVVYRAAVLLPRTNNSPLVGVYPVDRSTKIAVGYGDRFAYDLYKPE